MSTPVLDPATLERLRVLQENIGASADVLGELSEIFARDSDTYVDALESSLRAADGEQSRHILHTLKGAALSVGASQVADRCKALELAEPLPGPEVALELRGLVADALAALRAAKQREAEPA